MAADKTEQWGNREVGAEARRLGADLFGVADLAACAGLATDPPDLFAGFRRAILLGVRLPDPAVDGCVEGPTPLYYHAYAVANQALDHLAFDLARVLAGRGHRALPLPASKLLDPAAFTGNVSFKALGRLAGLGWQGKSLLLVNPELGPRFRLVAVLTDLPLAPGQPVRNRCGSCTRCTDACPAGAIKNVGTEAHYATRDEALYFDRCVQLCVGVFAKRPHIEKPICGVCVRACPWGQKRRGAG